MMALKRRFEVKPETYEENQKSVDYEMEWYDWVPFPKCGQCFTECNLYQCVDKSECKHIFCLHCVLFTMNSERNENVHCPICYSYCAGTLEYYHTKIPLPMKVTKMLYRGVQLITRIGTAVENLNNRNYWLGERNLGGKPRKD